MIPTGMRNFQIVERYIDRDLRNLHPIAFDAFSELAIDLTEQVERGNTDTVFRVFEGYRSPMRQRFLYEQEPRVTQANAWQSAHNFGLAVDFVPWVFKDGQHVWSWADEHPWDFLKERAKIFGLHVPIAWDRGHVEHQAWRDHKWMLRNM